LINAPNRLGVREQVSHNYEAADRPDGHDTVMSYGGDFNAPQRASSAPPQDQPGGLLAMLLDHLRSN
jgi:hypothetical protein